MKKLLSLLSLSFLLLAGSAASQAMDSDTLLQSPDRYRVVSAQNDSVVYVDINTIQAIQTMDYPNSLENLSCTLYVETYADPLDAEAYQSGRLIRQINEYKASFHANKREQSYSFDSTLTGVYAPDGQSFYVNTSADPLRLRENFGEKFPIRFPARGGKSPTGVRKRESAPAADMHAPRKERAAPTETRLPRVSEKLRMIHFLPPKISFRRQSAPISALFSQNKNLLSSA